MLCIGTRTFFLIIVADAGVIVEHCWTHTYIASHYVCIIIFRLRNVRIRIGYNPIFEIIRLILRSLCNTLKSLCAKIGINCVENHHSNELKLEHTYTHKKTRESDKKFQLLICEHNVYLHLPSCSMFIVCTRKALWIGHKILL